MEAPLLRTHLSHFIARVQAGQAQRDADRERQEAEALRREKDVIQRAAALQNVFLANISHELRTPSTRPRSS